MENEKSVYCMPAEVVTQLGNTFAEEARFRALEAALKINSGSQFSPSKGPLTVLNDAETIFNWLTKNPTI